MITILYSTDHAMEKEKNYNKTKKNKRRKKR
jgi:hypothetical protein